MRCLISEGGELSSGQTTFTVERDQATLVLRGVPARVCNIGVQVALHDFAA